MSPGHGHAFARRVLHRFAPASDPLSVRPFFENKARAFWTLQAAGWSGYLVLRSVVGISNGFSREKIIPVIIEAIWAIASPCCSRRCTAITDASRASWGCS